MKIGILAAGITADVLRSKVTTLYLMRNVCSTDARPMGAGLSFEDIRCAFWTEFS